MNSPSSWREQKQRASQSLSKNGSYAPSILCTGKWIPRSPRRCTGRRCRHFQRKERHCFTLHGTALGSAPRRRCTGSQEWRRCTHRGPTRRPRRRSTSPPSVAGHGRALGGGAESMEEGTQEAPHEATAAALGRNARRGARHRYASTHRRRRRIHTGASTRVI